MTWFRGLCQQEKKRELRGVSLVADRMVQGGVSYEEALRRFRRAYLLRAAVACDGNAVRTAARIGVHRNTLTRLLDAVGVVPAEGERHMAVRRGLTDAQVRDIRSYFTAHDWHGAIKRYAQAHGIPVRAVSNVIHGKSHTDVAA